MEATTINGENLRALMRRVPSPVTVVTTATEKEARGITIGSFTSVSLEPPLVSFNVDRAAQMHDVLTHASHFAVHIVGDRHDWLCDHFAMPGRSGREQLARVDHRWDPFGNPVLECALAVLHCRRYDVFSVGDHSIVVGEVVGLEDLAEGPSLLFYDRSYRKIGASL